MYPVTESCGRDMCAPASKARTRVSWSIVTGPKEIRPVDAGETSVLALRPRAVKSSDQFGQNYFELLAAGSEEQLSAPLFVNSPSILGERRQMSWPALREHPS